MTAINVVLQRDRAVMMTDAAMYLPSGLVIGFGQKAVGIPHLNATLACRGGQLQTALLAMEIGLVFETFDDVSLDRFEGSVRQLLHLHRESFAWADVQVVLCGFSKSGGARGFVYDSRADVAEEIEEFGFGPMLSDEEDDTLERLGCNLDGSLPIDRFDPIRHGIPTMEAQRRMRLNDIPGVDLDEPIHIVGGHMLVTECSATGVSQTVVHRWADQPGEMIHPTSTAPQVGALSRAERRRAEKLAKAHAA